MEKLQNAVQHSPTDWRRIPAEATKHMLDAVLPLGAFTQDQRDCMAEEFRLMVHAAPAEPTCKWFQEDDYDAADTYQAECGAHWTFMEGGPVHNSVKYCMCCGKPVTEIQAEIEPELDDA